MGATKRMAELIITQENMVSDTVFTAVRFVNMLGSNGSVVPVIERQIARCGEVFVLDMGEPVKIVDLVRDMIKLSGLKPGQDIEIEFTGIRPGENSLKSC